MLYLIVWGRDRLLIDLIRKSLAGHRRRNAKTAMMFTISLAFIVFAGAMFTLQANSITSNLRSAIGADLAIISENQDMPLNEDSMRDFLDTLTTGSNPIVQAFTFVTYPLDQTITDTFTDVQISNLAAFPWTGTMLVGVESQYLKTIYSQYYMISEDDPDMSYHQVNGKDDVIRSLYDDAGKASLPEEADGIQIPPVVISDPLGTKDAALQKLNIETYTEYLDVVVSEAYRYGLSIDVNVPMRLQTEIYLKETRTTKREYLCKVRAMLRKLPGFFFSSYRQTVGVSTTLITMENFERLFEEGIEARYAASLNDPEILFDNSSIPSQPPKQKVLVKLKSGASRDDREFVINGLRNFLPNDQFLVFDTTDFVESASVAIDLLIVFFNVVSIIAVILCFFLLWLSFDANVRENSWEFGVLLAVGLSYSQVIRTYIYEALALIITAPCSARSLDSLLRSLSNCSSICLPRCRFNLTFLMFSSFLSSFSPFLYLSEARTFPPRLSQRTQLLIP